MAKNTNNQKSPAPEPEAVMAEGADMAAKAADNVLNLNPGRGTRQKDANIFAAAKARVDETVSGKVSLTADARQKLSHASDLFDEGGEKAKEGRKLLSEVGTALYQARVSGALSADELSAMLRDTFGCRKKGEGGSLIRVPVASPDASATPFGEGEAIRKRIVRAHAAYEYANKEADGGKFFSPIDRKKVAQLVNNMEEGKLSIYSLYDYLAEEKNKAAETSRVNPAFDVKRIAAIVSSLLEAGAAETVAKSFPLQVAYGELIAALDTVSEKVEAIRKAA